MTTSMNDHNPKPRIQNWCDVGKELLVDSEKGGVVLCIDN